jgi:N-acyl-D-amino-acid deacylase
MAGSDGIFCGGFPHPRGWGSFARYLGRHTRELGDYTWSEAVTHLSTHAARRFRLTDRGMIRPGFAADLAVVDPSSVIDRSTYAAGRSLAEGVEHVVVNGALVLENGAPTGATPGRALRRG